MVLPLFLERVEDNELTRYDLLCCLLVYMTIYFYPRNKL